MKTKTDPDVLNVVFGLCIFTLLLGGFFGVMIGEYVGISSTFKDAEKIGLSYQNQKTGHWAWKICDYCRE